MQPSKTKYYWYNLQNLLSYEPSNKREVIRNALTVLPHYYTSHVETTRAYAIYIMESCTTKQYIYHEQIAGNNQDHTSKKRLKLLFCRNYVKIHVFYELDRLSVHCFRRAISPIIHIKSCYCDFISFKQNNLCI